jgi:hypothetical protein
MNQVFPLNNNKSWKSVLIQEDKLLLINKSYDSPDEFIKGYEDEGLGRLLKQKKEINFSEINSLAHGEKEADELTLHHNSDTTVLEFSDNKDLAATVDHIAARKQFTPQSGQVGSWKAIQSPVIGLGLVALFGWIVYGEAKTLESGGTIEITGRRRLYKQLFAWLADKLGSTGTLILASLLAVACLYFIYTRLKRPPSQILYS